MKGKLNVGLAAADSEGQINDYDDADMEGIVDMLANPVDKSTAYCDLISHAGDINDLQLLEKNLQS